MSWIHLFVKNTRRCSGFVEKNVEQPSHLGQDVDDFPIA